MLSPDVTANKAYEVLANSKIISNIKEYKALLGFFGKTDISSISLKLLFRASDHGFSSESFHKFCDHIPHTLVLIKTNYNKIIGGYTPLKWNKEVHYYMKD
jgi:hypothetical protein